jgi:hypothetical protein
MRLIVREIFQNSCALAACSTPTRLPLIGHNSASYGATQSNPRSIKPFATTEKARKYFDRLQPGDARMLAKYLRFVDLVDRNIVKNRTCLNNWVRELGFPPGQLTGPNTRLWREDEVEAWLASRPTTPKPAPPKPRGRPRKHQPVAQP